MDKEVITAADIETLINKSNKLKSGEMVIATLDTRVIKTNTGEPKIVKALTPERETNSTTIINFPGAAPIMGEGVKGEVIVDAFKNASVKNNKKEPFSLKRTFFTAIDKVVSSVNSIKMNFMRVIYKSDEFGRVYIVCDDNKRYYLNKEKNHFITEDGHYGEIKFNKDGTVDLTDIHSEDAVNDPNFIKFSYLYISPEAARRGEALISEEEDRLVDEFIRENPLPETSFASDISMESFEPESGKIINLDEYREHIEEGPKR